MPLLSVRFNPRPTSPDEWNNLIGLAETSRNILELARVYQWGRKYDSDVAAAAKNRALQLGFKASELERDQRGALRENLTDRALRYRAVATGPEGPKVCAFCGTTKKLMVGHVDGFEAHGEPDNLVWTCRSCNAHHANALKRAGMGRRTAQFNPSKAGGASNLGEWMQAVGAIRPRSQGRVKGPIGSSDRNSTLVGGSQMKVSDAVAMIRATPFHKRAEFAAKLAKRGGGRSRGGSDIPF
jgi:hypothetical protein